jgi:hypothetical protein
MLKIIHIVFSVCLFAFTDYAVATCPPAAMVLTAEMAQAAMHNASDHGFLWRISKDGRASYLYGTIHVAKFDWMFPGPVVSRALRETDTVALEMDMLDADIQRGIVRGMAALPVATMPESLAKRMRQQAEAVCVPYDTLAGLAPELQVTALTIMVGRQAGLNAEYAIDTVLAGIGHQTNKKVVSLESPEMQLQVLLMKDMQESNAFLEDSLAELESGRSLSLLKRISKVWDEGDHEVMTKFEEWCECLNTESERKVMKRALDDRNPALAEQIDKLHQSGKQVFAAVGSMHMFGELGLPLLLQKRGYRVEKVLFK